MTNQLYNYILLYANFTAMKKILLTFLIAASACCTVKAQSPLAIPPTYKNEIGVDITLLMANLFGFKDYYYPYDIYGVYGTPNAGLYLFTYKHYFGNSALRFGLGADMNSSKTSTESAVATAETGSSRFDLRIGYEFEKPLGEHWNLYYGLDVLMNSTSNDYKYEDPNNLYSYESNTDAMAFGGGPLVGISWKINPRIKLSTEANLQFVSTDAKMKTTYANTPESNYEGDTKTTEINANYPMFLYLELMF